MNKKNKNKKITLLKIERKPLIVPLQKEKKNNEEKK